MGRRGRKAAWYEQAGEPAREREALERRWFPRMSRRPELATLVTAQSAQIEPFHRWTRYRQGFSPELVRRFLAEYSVPRGDEEAMPILDPFSGSGTVVVECARRRVVARGLDASPALVLLALSRFQAEFVEPPEPASGEEIDHYATRLTHPTQRAALLAAEARRHAGDGRPLRAPEPLNKRLGEVVAMMRDDLRVPLAWSNECCVDDARDINTVDDESVGGMLTSPPYLSRYDYAAITDPLDELARLWDPVARIGARVPAHPRASIERQPVHPTGDDGAIPEVDDESGFDRPEASGDAGEFGESEGLDMPEDDWEPMDGDQSPLPVAPAGPHPAVTEARGVLWQAGHRRLARVVDAYFADMGRLLRAAARVLAPGAPTWIVIGGARLKDIYVPTDLVLAEMAADAGFDVEDVRVARDLSDARRRLGGLTKVAPRESVLVMRRR